MKKILAFLITLCIVFFVIIVLMHIENSAKEPHDEWFSIQVDNRESVYMQKAEIAGKDYMPMNVLEDVLAAEVTVKDEIYKYDTTESKENGAGLTPVEAEKIARFVVLYNYDADYVNNAIVKVEHQTNTITGKGYYEIICYGNKYNYDHNMLGSSPECPEIIICMEHNTGTIKSIKYGR